MTSLAERKTKLTFESCSTVRERGRSREVVIEAEQTFAYVRLKGTRTRFAIEVERDLPRRGQAGCSLQQRRDKVAARKGLK